MTLAYTVNTYQMLEKEKPRIGKADGHLIG